MHQIATLPIDIVMYYQVKIGFRNFKELIKISFEGRLFSILPFLFSFMSCSFLNQVFGTKSVNSNHQFIFYLNDYANDKGDVIVFWATGELIKWARIVNIWMRIDSACLKRYRDFGFCINFTIYLEMVTREINFHLTHLKRVRF